MQQKQKENQIRLCLHTLALYLYIQGTEHLHLYNVLRSYKIMAGKLVHPLIRSILERYRTIWALNHMKWLAQWDLNTYMPEDGSKARAEALSKVEILSQSLFL